VARQADPRRTAGAVSLIVFFIVWQIAAASGIWNQTFVPYPSTVWRAFIDVSTTHDGVRGYAGYLLWEHLYMTLRRVLAGVVIGVALGVLLGLVMGSIAWVRSLLEPWLTFLRALPPLAYFFLLAIWLGIDEAPKITLLALAALPPAAVTTTAAVVAAPVGLKEAARALGATRGEVIRDVVVPSALPETFTGIRLAVGMAYSSVVAAELFNGIPGIGGLVKDASNYNNTPRCRGRDLRHRDLRSGHRRSASCRRTARCPMERKSMKFKAALAALAITTLALAGCSVDRSAQQADKPTIRIGYQTFPSGDLIVKNNRWLEDALPDYNIKWTKFDSGADVNTAFIAKELDFGALGSSPVARGLSAPLNIPYKVVFVLDVAGDNEALVARNGSGINTIAELRGKRVGTPFASTAHYSLLAALAQNGLSANDVQLVDLQPQAALAAFDRGDVDAVYTWLPTLDQVRKNGKDLITSRQLAKDGKPTLDLAAVSDEFADAHPDVVDTWRQQQARALNLIHDDPAAAAKAIASENGLSPEEVAGQLKQAVFPTPAEVASPEWLGSDGNPGNLAVNLQSASQFLAEQKQIPAGAPLQAFQDAIYTNGLPGVITQ
jgi:taurine transport system substrate-binding protein